ncbi:MAG: transglycosylase domain-containing protein [Bacillota bacterium]
MSRFQKRALITIILLFAIISGIIIGSVSWIIKETPDISNYGRWKPSEATMIYSEDNKLLSRLYQENRVYVPIEKIPQELQQAVIAIEDNRFYDHFGIDLWAIARALWVDIKGGGIIQGGSTLTQQLAKNALLTNERTLYRKIQEAYLAIQFERMYTKKEILEFYLNEIYLGNNVYGAQTAAKFYFDKEVQDLNLTESALLAGLPKAPNNYSPYKNKQVAKVRRNVVLEQMEKFGYITERQAKKARQQSIEVENGLERKTDLAPYFVRHVRKKLIEMYGAQAVYNGGLKVYTTLDYKMQTQAEKTVNEAFNNYIPSAKREEGKAKLQPQVALTTINPQNGHVKAMIGGRGEEDKYNRVTQARRQPGSAFKPFVYTTAIKQGLSPGSIIDDSLKSYQIKHNDQDQWIPKNYNDKYLGPTTLRVGLAKSINVMAVKLLDEVGIDNTIQTAEEMGISSLVKQGRKNDRNLPLALGGLTKGISPLEMATSYGVLANQGIKTEPISILKVVDNRGNVILDNDPKQEIVLDKDVAYLITDMLKSVLARGPDIWGTGWHANIDRPAAGKTGTTNDYGDAWFVGYTPNLVTSIWVGEDKSTKMVYEVINDNNKSEEVTISSSQVAQMWSEYMRQITKDQPIQDFQRPDNIITEEICIESGKLPNQYCPEQTIREEIFIKGTEPTSEGTLHKETAEVKVDTSNNKLATDYCPPEEVETYTYQLETGYIVDDNEVPIKKIDPDTNLPLTDEEGNYIYKQIPEEECLEHKPESLQNKVKDRTDKIKDKFKDFFNRF